jgi:hypothetical protein
MTDPFSRLHEGPLASAGSAGLVQNLYDADVLKACEVPLAVFHWFAGSVDQSGTFRFLDNWSVRRRVTVAQPGRWQPADARRAEREALLQQFQEHIDDLYVDSPQTVEARERFAYLPPIGVLPLQGNGRRGFEIDKFFSGLKTRPAVGTIPQPPPAYPAYTVIEASRVTALLEESLVHAPLDVASDEVIWIYQVRENIQATRVAGNTVQPYVIFARGAVPYHGHANWDVSHWGYGTFT